MKASTPRGSALGCGGEAGVDWRFRRLEGKGRLAGLPTEPGGRQVDQQGVWHLPRGWNEWKLPSRQDNRAQGPYPRGTLPLGQQIAAVSWHHSVLVAEPELRQFWYRLLTETFSEWLVRARSQSI